MSKKTLNAANLEALGASKLAALLIEVSNGSADIKRRLRLELSHNLGTDELAHAVRKRLVTLRKSTSYVGWRKRKALIKDLGTQVSMIVDKITPEDPTTGFELLWQFVEMAPSIYNRVDDSKGDVGDVFRAAIGHFEHIAPRAVLSPKALADQMWTVISDNGYGVWDGIIELMADTLGPTGLDHLKQHAEAFASEPLQDDADDHEALQFLRTLRSGQNYAADRKARFVKACLQEIAAAAGDTSAYIAQYSQEDLRRKSVAAEVALIYLEEGRADDALTLLDSVERDDLSFGQDAWDASYLATLDALGRSQDAQNHRWTSFTNTLHVEHLRTYLKGLPDFDDVDAEDDAMAHALAYPDASIALTFCIQWPNLLTASQLVESRYAEFDGDQFEILTPAADALRTRHPLAAVLLLRAMIDVALHNGRSARYGYAADHLADCVALDGDIQDYGPFPSHDTYLHAIQTLHARKASFWAKVP